MMVAEWIFLLCFLMLNVYVKGHSSIPNENLQSAPVWNPTAWDDYQEKWQKEQFTHPHRNLAIEDIISSTTTTATALNLIPNQPHSGSSDSDNHRIKDHHRDAVNQHNNDRSKLSSSTIHQHNHPDTLQSYYNELIRRQQHQQHQQETREIQHSSLRGAHHETHRMHQMMNPTFSYSCTSLPKTIHNRWLHAESEPTGLCNQLFGVYSYLAAAFYYNSSLIVDNLYSRTSFEHEWPIPQSKWTSLPFSSFFDWYHFSNFWKVRGVGMIERYQYEHCPEPTERLRPVELIRDPPFWPYDYNTKIKMLELSNLTIPLPENIILELIAARKFITFGFLFQTPALLLDIFESLQPAPLITNFIQIIQQGLHQQLSKDTTRNHTNSSLYYIVAHVRLENDYHAYLNETERRAMHREAIAYLINNNTCLSTWPRDPHNPSKLINAPPLYIASGLWANRTDLQETLNLFTTLAGWDDVHLQELSLQDYTLYLLYKAGFRQIFTKETIIHRLERKQSKFVQRKEKRERDIAKWEEENTILDNNGAIRFRYDNGTYNATFEAEKRFYANETIVLQKEISFLKETYVDYLQYHRFLPEQLAMIDLFISRFAPCFCNAHISSSFSYWVLRMRYLSQHKHYLSVFDITEADYGIHYSFAFWGV